MTQGRYLVAIYITMLTSAFSADLQYVGPHPERGASDAVIVPDVALVHTAQFMAVNEEGQAAGHGTIQAEVDQILTKLKAALASATSNLEKLVKLNVYITAVELRPDVDSALAKAFPANRKPAISYVVSPLPVANVRVAMDAVAVSDSVSRMNWAAVDESMPKSAYFSVMPAGSRIYVAGQAEKGSSLSEATRNTLTSLKRTLEFLGSSDQHIVQLKAFLSPMDDVKTVTAAISDFFGEPDEVPPLVFVEWTAPLIEIELIAWGGDGQDRPVVEFITPPGMTTSPVFSRVARINRTPSVYTSGLFAPDAADASGETQAIFGQLEQVLEKAGSDFKHLVKATYYCSTNEASQKLNQLRPNYYDPKRPPSASKAMVRSVGLSDCELTLDMIAVPKDKGTTPSK